MREIKFRGKCNDGTGWIYGSLVILPTFTAIIEYTDGEDTATKGFIDPDSVGQYTGLHDCEGREIYEGDVVRVVSYGEESTHVVKFNPLDDGYPAFDLVPDLECECNCLSYCMAGIETTITVIGNIVENPELLND